MAFDDDDLGDLVFLEALHSEQYLLRVLLLCLLRKYFTAFSRPQPTQRATLDDEDFDDGVERKKKERHSGFVN